MWPLMSLLVGGREPIIKVLLSWSNFLEVVGNLALAQTRTKYFSACAASCSNNATLFQQFVRYCSESHAIAAYLDSKSLVNKCALITLLASHDPSWWTAWCSGNQHYFSAGMLIRPGPSRPRRGPSRPRQGSYIFGLRNSKSLGGHWTKFNKNLNVD